MKGLCVQRRRKEKENKEREERKIAGFFMLVVRAVGAGTIT